ncbi:hypothetical protein Vadar_012032 [Vaccinium darrowii]|uniref:Uncharacterized protein n=1 Tax=Vaccinium darrowii TaxID=229202 RepID=A0ACB7XQ40_9ERIC|nr:hypothetical protein Vadar_012032 [Vaccinium darrowii]
MEGRYGWTSLRNEEFQEEDVWAVLKEATYFSSSKVDSTDSTSHNSRQQLPGTASIMIPRVDNNSGQEREMYPKSAPVKIPNWSNIYGNNSKTASWLDLDDNGGGGGSGGDGEDEDDDGKTMPPHEWMAKKLARSNTFSFSVCEGAGRTLKGRDLSRVRNTVLTKTGFLE